MLDMKMNKKVICKDGFTMSVQAGETQYCHPRETGAPRYTEVEIGFPNEPEVSGELPPGIPYLRADL